MHVGWVFCKLWVVLWKCLYIPQRQKRWGVVTSRRRALDAALVLDYLITHDAHFLCDRDTMPACAHVVQSVCPQVQCGVHTNTATLMFGLAQLSAREDKKQVRNAGDIDSASSSNARRTSTSHTTAIAAVGPQRSRPSSVLFASIVASMLPLPCLARHAALHLAAPCYAGAAPLCCALYRTPRNPSARPARPAAFACIVYVCVCWVM